LTQTQALGSTANVFYSKRNEKFWCFTYTVLVILKKFTTQKMMVLVIYQKLTSISFNPKFFYYPSEKTTFWFGLNGTYDDRIGGDVTKIESGENGIHQYTEENISKRLSSQAVYKTQIDSISSLNIKNSISFFDRNLTIPDFSFDGKQFNTFTEITYQKSASLIKQIGFLEQTYTLQTLMKMIMQLCNVTKQT
jgi:iron complex outermembrane receptor protein